jgi:SAM-dependent methyltransferase
MILFSQPGLTTFQNKVYTNPESARAAPVADVELVQCPTTGLVYNHLFDPQLLPYDADYQNEQALAEPFREHLRQVLDVVDAHFDKRGSGIEIGCGKGYFLRLLAGAGYQVTGLDPAYEGESPLVRKQYYDAQYDGPSPEFVVLRHVLEHIADPWGFLGTVARLSGPECLVYVEVPCFDWIVNHGAFFDVFYEHRNYFTEDALAGAFSDVRATGHLFGGQYLFVVARVGSFQEPTLRRQFFPLPLNERKDRIVEQLEPGLATFVWGAGAKGVTLANILWRDGVPVDGLVDMNPAKQSKYVGLSGLPVFGEERVTRRDGRCNVIVMNSVYEDRIRSLLPGDASVVVAA